MFLAERGFCRWNRLLVPHGLVLREVAEAFSHRDPGRRRAGSRRRPGPLGHALPGPRALCGPAAGAPGLRGSGSATVVSPGTTGGRNPRVTPVPGAAERTPEGGETGPSSAVRRGAAPAWRGTAPGGATGRTWTPVRFHFAAFCDSGDSGLQVPGGPDWSPAQLLPGRAARGQVSEQCLRSADPGPSSLGTPR